MINIIRKEDAGFIALKAHEFKIYFFSVKMIKGPYDLDFVKIDWNYEKDESYREVFQKRFKKVIDEYDVTILLEEAADDEVQIG